MPKSVNLDSKKLGRLQPAVEAPARPASTPLGRMSLQVRNAEQTLSRRSTTLSDDIGLDDLKSNVSMGQVKAKEGPQAKARAHASAPEPLSSSPLQLKAEAKAVAVAVAVAEPQAQIEQSEKAPQPTPLKSPFDRLQAADAAAGAMGGGADLATGVMNNSFFDVNDRPAEIGGGVLGGGALVLGAAAGGLSWRVMSNKINRLQTQLTALEAKADRNEFDTELMQRLPEQIRELKKERLINASVTLGSTSFGVTEVALSFGGENVAASAVGVPLSLLSIVLGTMGAVRDGKEMLAQRKVNEGLKRGLEELKPPAPKDAAEPPNAARASNASNAQAPERAELTESLIRVAEFAHTSGVNRKRGKLVSMLFNGANALTGAVGLGVKIAAVAGGGLALGSALMITGGVVGVAALGFAVWKYAKYRKTRQQASEPLRNPVREKVEHNKLMQTNKYYALRFFVNQIQNQPETIDVPKTLKYFKTALRLDDAQARHLFNKLQSNASESMQHLADALFRGKPIPT